jgi:cytochrome c oxidase cbb3-type subunit III
VGIRGAQPQHVREGGADAADGGRRGMSRKDKPRDQVLGHADEADGIEEYDNPLPDWWLGLFWFTIIWALGYTLHYHFIADRSQEKALAAEIAAAEVRWPSGMEQGPVTFTAEMAEAGKAVYQTNCLACHGATLEGGIGPNLKDGEWVHGGSPEAVVKTIAEGVPAKGMPAWGPILGPERVRQVAAYILAQQP